MSLTPLAALERRRTIRNYDPNWQIPKDQMDKIMNAAQLSPTACNFQGQDYIVVTNKEKLAKLEKIIIDSLPEDNFKKHFVERKERHGVNNVVTCDAPCVVLIVKNERANEDWIKIDAGIASMSIMMAAQNFGIESMCLGVVAMKCSQDKCEELFGLKKGSLLLGVALGKPKGELKLHEKDIKSKVSYVE
jgi:nitroreductase